LSDLTESLMLILPIVIRLLMTTAMFGILMTLVIL
jgi:hypothetical protein